MKILKISLVVAAIFCSAAANAQTYRATAPSQRLPANRLPVSAGQIGTVPAGNSSPRVGASRSALQDINSGDVPQKTYVPPAAPQTFILPQTTLPVSSYPAGTTTQPAVEEETEIIDPTSATPSTTTPGGANQVIPSPSSTPVLNGQQARPATIGQPATAPRSNVTTPASAPVGVSRPNH